MNVSSPCGPGEEEPRELRAGMARSSCERAAPSNPSAAPKGPAGNQREPQTRGERAGAEPLSLGDGCTVRRAMPKN